MENRTIAERQTQRKASDGECVGWRRVDDLSIAGCGKRDCDGPDYRNVTGETRPGVTRASE